MPGAPGPAVGRKAGKLAQGPRFEQVLQEQLQRAGGLSPGSLRFSAHAHSRLRSQGVQFGPEEMRRLEQAVQQAAAKGSREALVLFPQRDLALVVSVVNRTVITAVEGTRMRENVFTNIDSVVIAD